MNILKDINVCYLLFNFEVNVQRLIKIYFQLEYDQIPYRHSLIL